jgi:hypothetical protein
VIRERHRGSAGRDPTRHPADDPREGPTPRVDVKDPVPSDDPGPGSVVGALLLKQNHHVDDGAARVIDNSLRVDDAAVIPGRQRCAFAFE